MEAPLSIVPMSQGNERHTANAVATADADVSRSLFSPIRTLTVGPGIPPDQSFRSSEGVAGFTAGEDFHLAPRTSDPIVRLTLNTVKRRGVHCVGLDTFTRFCSSTRMSKVA